MSQSLSVGLCAFAASLCATECLPPTTDPTTYTTTTTIMNEGSIVAAAVRVMLL